MSQVGLLGKKFERRTHIVTPSLSVDILYTDNGTAFLHMTVESDGRLRLMNIYEPVWCKKKIIVAFVWAVSRPNK